MHRTWIALLCCACLLLGGCQALELLEQVKEGDSAPQTQQQNSQTEAPAVQQGARETPAEPDGAGSILQNAGADDLFAVLQNPDAQIYRSLRKAAAEIDDCASGDGSGHETVLIVPLKEHVLITVEEVWLDFPLNFMYCIGTIGEFSGKQGEPLALNTFLAEGIPHTRVVARHGDRQAVWYCHYDSMGAPDVLYVGAVTPEPIDEYSSGINMLSMSAATVASLFAEDEKHMTPEYFSEIPDAYWVTIADAMTLYKLESDGSFNPNIAEPMRIPARLVGACRLALFSDMSDRSLYTQGAVVEKIGDEYLLFPSYDDESMIRERISSQSSADGKTGFVKIAITFPEISPNPVIYRIDWAANEPVDIYSPFQYHMTGIRVVSE